MQANIIQQKSNPLNSLSTMSTLQAMPRAEGSIEALSNSIILSNNNHHGTQMRGSSQNRLPPAPKRQMSMNSQQFMIDNSSRLQTLGQGASTQNTLAKRSTILGSQQLNSIKAKHIISNDGTLLQQTLITNTSPRIRSQTSNSETQEILQLNANNSVSQSDSKPIQKAQFMRGDGKSLFLFKNPLQMSINEESVSTNQGRMSLNGKEIAANFKDSGNTALDGSTLFQNRKFYEKDREKTAIKHQLVDYGQSKRVARVPAEKQLTLEQILERGGQNKPEFELNNPLVFKQLFIASQGIQ